MNVGFANESAALAREALVREIEYRREIKWRIFSWSSTLLSAITGGVATLKLLHGSSPSLSCQCTMLLVTLILGVYSSIWVYVSQRHETLAWENLREFAEFAETSNCGPTRWECTVGAIMHPLALVLLTTVAAVSVFIPLGTSGRKSIEGELQQKVLISANDQSAE
ncbi:MAG: hypothetical protein AAFU85_04705 [Planctomycetota bacterium]